MTQKILAGVLALVGLLIYPLSTQVRAAGPPPPPPPPGFKQFVSARNHYRLLYPDSWTTKAQGGAQYFYGPRVAGFRTNVNVVTVSGAQGVKTSQLGSLLANADRKEGGTIEQMSKIRVAGHSGWWVSGKFTRKISGRIVHDRFATAAFLQGNKVWEITLSTAPSAYAGTVATFRIIVASFALT